MRTTKMPASMMMISNYRTALSTAAPKRFKYSPDSLERISIQPPFELGQSLPAALMRRRETVAALPRAVALSGRDGFD